MEFQISVPLASYTLTGKTKRQIFDALSVLGHAKPQDACVFNCFGPQPQLQRAVLHPAVGQTGLRLGYQTGNQKQETQ